MDNQEFFAKCVLHLRQQQAKASGFDGACVYETSDGRGLKCAIGGVMSPGLLAIVKSNQLNGGASINTLLQRLPEAREFFAGVSPALLKAMQRTHDEYPRYAWENQFRLIAQIYNVEMPDGPASY